MRVVLDTNVIVSALIWGGSPFELLRVAIDGNIEFFSSPILLEELSEVLARDHLACSSSDLICSSSDNVYIERFWRSFKQEDFYLHDYGGVAELRQAIEGYIDFYNNNRWHQSLSHETPASVYWDEQSKTPEDSWASPTDQPAPFGTCGQVMDNASALPIT